MHNKILDKSIIFFLISAVLGILISYKSIYPFKIALVLVMVYTFYYCVKYLTLEKIYIYIKNISKLHWMFYIILIYFTMSYFWISYSGEGYLHFIKNFIKDILVSIIIIYYSSNVNKLMTVYKTLAFIFGIEILFGLLQLYPDIYMPNSTITYASSIPTGFMNNRNDFGFILAIIFPYILFLKNIFYKIIVGISVFVIILFIGSIVAVVAVNIALLVYLIFVKRKFLFTSLIYLTMGFVFFSGYFSNYIPSHINHKIHNIKNIITFVESNPNKKNISGSANHKRQVNKIMISELKNTHYMGIGAGQSFYVLQKNSKKLDEKNYSVHNFWIQLLVESGSAFFIFFLVWYIYLIFNLFKIYQNSKNNQIKNLAGATSLSLGIFSIACLSPSSVFHIYSTWILLGFAVAIININLHLKEKLA